MTKIMHKIPENAVMCIPDWITNYQPVDNNVDARLFNYFRSLYTLPHGSENQQKTISRIYNILVSQKLINEKLIYKRMESISKGCNFSFSQDNYDEVLSEGYMWLSKLITKDNITAPRICFFDLYAGKTASLNKGVTKDLTKGLTNWISYYIAWRLFDIHNQELAQLDSLDIPLFDDDFASNETQLDHIPDGLQDVYNTTTLEELLNGNLINELSAIDKQKVLNDHEKYLQTDPYGLLTSRHIPGYPECNYKILTARLILKQPPDKIRTIYRDFNIPQSQEQTVYSHLTRTFYPTIVSINLELGCYPEKFKDAILNDADGSLKNCHKKVTAKVVYDAQILAQKLLPLFQHPHFIFTTVVNYLNNLHVQKDEFKTSVIPIYHEQYFAVYSKIAAELQQQGLKNITSFDILTYWETATIETFVTELNNQGYKKITCQQIKTFWDDKARKCLGKLARSLK